MMLPPDSRPGWLLDPWLPSREAVLLHGRPGSGKSLLLQHIATCVAAGIEFFGADAARGTALLMLAEDAREEVRWRQAAICRTLGIEPGALDGRLFIESRAGCCSALLRVTPAGTVATTPRFEALERTVAELRPSLVAFDNLDALVLGDWGTPSLGAQIRNRFMCLVRDHGCTVLLAAASLADAGAIALASTARSRLSLEVEADGTRTLRKYVIDPSTVPDALALAWHADAFVPARDGARRP